MLRHVKQLHGEEGLELVPRRPSFSCEQCKATFSYSENVLQHRRTAHGFKVNTVNLEFANADGEWFCYPWIYGEIPGARLALLLTF